MSTAETQPSRDDALAVPTGNKPTSKLLPDGLTREEYVQTLQHKMLKNPYEALLEQASQVELLTHDEEIRLSRRFQNGDEQARIDIVAANIRLVARFTKKYESSGVDRADLIQAGVEGLDFAARKFDPEKGLRFSTLAGRVIHQYLRGEVAKMGRTVVLPEDTYLLIGAALSIKDRLMQEKKTTRVTPADISPHIGRIDWDRGRGEKNDDKDAQKIELALRSGKPSQSLNEPIDGTDLDSPQAQDFLIDKFTSTEDTALLAARVSELHRALGQLKPDEIQLIDSLYGLSGNQPVSIKSAAELYGVSEKLITNMRDAVLNKLKEIIGEDEA